MTLQPCEINANQLMAYLDDPASNPDLPGHVAECRYCQVRLLAMGAAASSRGAERREHQEVITQLEAFVEDEAAGVPPGDEYTPLMIHLVLCPHCFAVYQELRLMDEWVINNALPAPPRSAYRPPDLSFLRTPFEWIAAQVRAEGTRVLRTLRLHLALLFQPSPLLPVPVRTTRGVEIETKEALELREVSLGAEQLGTLDVDVKLYADGRDPSLARLEVYARAVERADLNFSGTRVVLRFADGREIVRHTDEAGLAYFEGLPEAELPAAVLEITPPE